MPFMTDKTPIPTAAALAALRADPSFGVWFRIYNPPASLAVKVLSQLAGAYLAMVVLRGIRGANPFPSLQEFLPLLGFLAVLELVLTYWRYRRFIKSRREASGVAEKSAGASGTSRTTGNGDSPIIPVIAPATVSNEGHVNSPGGHAPADGGGHSGGGDSGGGGGGDGGC